jgi:methylase of polypeptide subunit release factors
VPPVATLVTEERTRTAGAVYTPEWLVSFVLDRVVEAGADPAQGRWLDPACGDGAFLVGVARALAGQVPAHELAETIERSLFGTDVNESACAVARDRVVAVVETVAGPQRDDYLAANVRSEDFLESEAADDEFDVVVGNPPFVSATSLTADDKTRYLERFETAWGRLDLYALFLEHALRCLRPGGRLAFITPDKWLTAQSSGPLRAYVASGFAVRAVERFDRHDLFHGVATVPCVAVIERAAPIAVAPCRWWDATGGEPVVGAVGGEELAIASDGRPWVTAHTAPVGPRSAPLSELVERISAGLATGLNQCFILDHERAQAMEPELLRPVARGRDVQAGAIRDSGLWLLLPYHFNADGNGAQLVDLDDFPLARAHVERYRKALEQRHCVRVWGKAWYDLHDPVTFDLAMRPKILLPDVAYEPRFALDLGGLVPVHSAYYLLLRPDAQPDGERLTALLNSPSVAADLRRRAPTAKSGYRRFRTAVLRDVVVPRDGA